MKYTKTSWAMILVVTTVAGRLWWGAPAKAPSLPAPKPIPTMPAANELPPIQDNLNEAHKLRQSLEDMKKQVDHTSDALGDSERIVLEAKKIVRQVADIEADYDSGRLDSAAYAQAHEQLAAELGVEQNPNR